jgi:hypothetical protein
MGPFRILRMNHNKYFVIIYVIRSILLLYRLLSDHLSFELCPILGIFEFVLVIN